jgi:hypothetical protein
MDITFGKKDTDEAKILDQLMEYHEEVMIYTIKKS